MLTEHTVKIENSLLGRGLQIDSPERQWGLLYVTDAQINPRCTQVRYTVSLQFPFIS